VILIYKALLWESQWNLSYLKGFCQWEVQESITQRLIIQIHWTREALQSTQYYYYICPIITYTCVLFRYSANRYFVHVVHYANEKFDILLDVSVDRIAILQSYGDIHTERKTEMSLVCGRGGGSSSSFTRWHFTCFSPLSNNNILSPTQIFPSLSLSLSSFQILLKEYIGLRHNSTQSSLSKKFKSTASGTNKLQFRI